MASLEHTATHLISSSLSQSTRKSYNATLKDFSHFVSSLGPIYQSTSYNSGHVILYISHLFNNQVSPQTIATKMSALAYYFKLQGYPDITSQFLVAKTLSGVKKLSPTVDQRLPITIPILQQLMSKCSSMGKSMYHILLLQAMMSVSFYGFLRPGEITKSPHNLMIDQLQLSSHKASITFRTFKHHSGHTITIDIPSQPGPTCPVQALTNYLAMRRYDPGPLFCHPTRDAISYATYHDWFLHVLSLSQLQGKYNTHSFRIGAATWAASRGVSHTIIQQMGRWRSMAYMKYIRMPVVNV